MSASGSSDAPLPDPAQALEFLAALYGGAEADAENVHFRAVPEPKDGRASVNLHYARDEHFADNLRHFLEWCAQGGRAAFFLPGIVRGNGTGKADVEMLPAVLVDFDQGD